MNKKEVEQILLEHGISVKKKFGQNFLLDKNVLSKIATSLSGESVKNIIEIGPGLGFLTNELVKETSNLVLYEIDDEMVNFLSTKSFPHTIIRNIDILQVNLEKEIKEYFNDEKVSLIANLPYYITTAILTKFLTETKQVENMVVMMQKEVAERICGKPKTKDYNALSVFIQYYSNAKILFNVSPQSFYPAPDVESSVVLIKRKEIINKALNDDKFNKFVKDIFSQRRKTLMNNLSKAMTLNNEEKLRIKDILTKQGHSLSVRSEELSVDEIVNLFNDIYNKN